MGHYEYLFKDLNYALLPNLRNHQKPWIFGSSSVSSSSKSHLYYIMHGPVLGNYHAKMEKFFVQTTKNLFVSLSNLDLLTYPYVSSNEKIPSPKYCLETINTYPNLQLKDFLASSHGMDALFKVTWRVSHRPFFINVFVSQLSWVLIFPWINYLFLYLI